MAAPLAIVGIGASVLGAGVQAYGAEAKGAADQAMYGYQAQVATMNANIARKNAAESVKAAGSQAYRTGLQYGQQLGQQRVAQGASGIDMTSGSATQVREATQDFASYDQRMIREGGARKAYGHMVEAATRTAEAGADVVAGDQASKAADISAAGSILGGISSVASKWTQASTAFA